MSTTGCGATAGKAARSDLPSDARVATDDRLPLSALRRSIGRGRVKESGVNKDRFLAGFP